MKIALLDADIITYIAARVTQKEIDWEDGEEPMITTDLKGAKRRAKETIAQWLEMSGAEKAVLCFTDRHAAKCTFRHNVCPTYKASRSEKPVVFEELDKAMREHFESLEFKYLEGDDVIGLTMTNPDDPHKYVSVSTDKDMQTLPGWHLDPVKMTKPQLTRPMDADWYWMFQTLTGDAVDEYKGCPGIGKAKADKIINARMGLGELWTEVVNTYNDMYDHPRWGQKFTQAGPYEEALMNARCARILRWGDYDFDTEEVKLWTP